MLLLLTRETIRFNYLLLVAVAAAAVSAVAVSVDDSLTFVACDTGRSKHENNNKLAALRTKTTTKPYDATMRHDENQH
jgi:hypothetical protein